MRARPTGEAESLAQKVTIDAELVARAGTGAERTRIGVFGRCRESISIAREHLDVCQKVMCEENRLGTL